MRNAFFVTALALCLPASALAQYPPGGMGNDGEFGRPEDRNTSVPRIREGPVVTIAEINGPLSPDDFRKMFPLDDAQLKEYAQVFDSFTVATSEPRDAAKHRLEQLGAAYGRDSAAVEYYKDRLKELGKILKDAQSKFDERMKRLLTKEQQKQYRDWRKRQDDGGKDDSPPVPRKRDGH